MPVSSLCNVEYDCPLKLDFIIAGDNVIGSTQTTVNELLASGGKFNQFEQGSLNITNFKIETEYTFLEYLYSGWQISLFVGIDFTGSNGNPQNPSSLHYLGANNQYDSAINSVGSILQPYDYNGAFPVYGFGGNPNGMGTSHCFALTFDESNPEVMGA